MSDARSEARGIASAIKRNYRPNVVPVEGVVQSVVRGENKAAISARVRLASGQDVTVPLHGMIDVRDGQAVDLERNVNEPTSPTYRVAGIKDSLTPFPQAEGSFTVDAPIWLSPAITSRPLPATAGGQAAEVAVHLKETPESQGPREMTIFYRLAGAATWQQVKVPNVGGQDAELHTTLPGSYPLGAVIDVYAITYTHGTATSDPTEVRTHVIAGDATTPSAPAGSAISVDLNINLTALVRLPAPSQPLVFDRWEIRVAGDAAGGAGSFVGILPTTYETTSRERLITLPQPGPIYIRVREVTRSNVPGAWWPSSGFSGPYNVVANDVVVDTTPPPAPSIASAIASSSFDPNGNVIVTITVTLAAYSPPSDFATFIYSFNNGTSWVDRPSALSPYQEDHARQGVTYQVRVQAVDRAGNRSAFSSTVPVVTPTVTQPPKPGAAPTVLALPGGILVSWPVMTATVATGEIVQYDLQRSTNGVNWSDLPFAGRATAYVDAGLPLATNFYYRYRARNANGNPGPYSDASFPLQAAPISTVNFAANQIDANHIIAHGSITAELMEAVMLLVNEIKARSPGKITAGDGNVLIDEQGMTVSMANGVRFVAIAPENYAAMKNNTNRRGELVGVDGWRGATGRGALFTTYPLGFEGSVPGVWFEGQPIATVGRFAIRVSGQYIDFFEDQGAGAQKVLGLSANGFTRGGSTRAGLFTAVPATGGINITGVANTDYDFYVGDEGVPGDSSAVYWRLLVNIAAGATLFAYPVGGTTNDGPRRLGTGSNDYWNPLVACSVAGMTRFRCTGAFTLSGWPIGYHR